MPSHRIAQVNELLRQELSQLVERVLELPPNVMLTIKRVEATRDLSSAKVWVSILPIAEQDAALTLLKDQLPDIQQQVARRVRLQTMPKLRLRVDQSEEHAQRVTRRLDQLRK